MSDDRILINQYYRVLKCVVASFLECLTLIAMFLVYITLVFLICSGFRLIIL